MSKTQQNGKNIKKVNSNVGNKKTTGNTKQQECNNVRQALSQLRRLNWESIEFKNDNQKNFFSEIENNDITICAGPAGCGKTYITVYQALRQLASKDNSIDGIVLVKPLVEAEGEKIGYLPGNVDEKTEPFMMSFYYNIEQIIGKQRLDILRSEKIIQVIPLAFMRGLTFSDKIVILDEAQNATVEQIKMFITRLGMRSRYIITGDLEQTDKHGVNGLEDSIKRFAGVRNVGLSWFNKEDIVRHPLIPDLLERYKPTYVVPNISAEMTISQHINSKKIISNVNDYSSDEIKFVNRFDRFNL